MSSDSSSSYRIYLLTFWLEEADDRNDPERWRFRLEEPKSGWRSGYVGVADLCAGLTKEIKGQEEAANLPGQSGE